MSLRADLSERRQTAVATGGPLRESDPKQFAVVALCVQLHLRHRTLSDQGADRKPEIAGGNRRMLPVGQEDPKNLFHLIFPTLKRLLLAFQMENSDLT